MEQLQDQLFLLVRDKDVARLRAWLDNEGRGIDMNPRNDQEQTPLYWACESDDPELVQLLVDRGADVNAAESFGFTPLHLAAYLGHTGLTRVLLGAGASVKATNKEGSTALHLAAKQNNVEVVQLILKLSAPDLLAKDNAGNTPIQLCEKDNECYTLLRDQLLQLRQRRDVDAIANAPTNASTTSSPSPGASAHDKQQLDKMSKALALLSSNIDVERARVGELEARLAETRAEADRLRGAAARVLCRQCERVERAVALLPCMHMHFCAACAKVMQQCATCNVTVTGKLPAKLD